MYHQKGDMGDPGDLTVQLCNSDRKVQPRLSPPRIRLISLCKNPDSQAFLTRDRTRRTSPVFPSLPPTRSYRFRVRMTHGAYDRESISGIRQMEAGDQCIEMFRGNKSQCFVHGRGGHDFPGSATLPEKRPRCLGFHQPEARDVCSWDAPHQPDGWWKAKSCSTW
jgi:hypothetical protein